MSALSKISLFALIVLSGMSVWAQDDPSTPKDLFALDGLALGTQLMLEPIDNVIAKFGLPDGIEIRNDRATWDVDVEETPVEWRYPGFTVTTRYLRQGETVQGARSLVPGPYREDRTVVRLQVSDPGVRLLFGIHVGANVERVIEQLGPPPRYDPARTIVEYREYTEYASSRTGVDVTFILDSPGGRVVEIVWEKEAWH